MVRWVELPRELLVMGSGKRPRSDSALESPESWVQSRDGEPCGQGLSRTEMGSVRLVLPVGVETFAFAV